MNRTTTCLFQGLLSCFNLRGCFNRLGFHLRGYCLLGVFASLTAPVAESAASDWPNDWPNWRGPQQNRVSQETGLIDRWDPKGGPGSNLLWKSTELGGRSTPIVMHGRLYSIARDQVGTPTEGSKVVCLDAATGEKLWQHRMNVYLTDVPDTRVGWSSVCGDPQTGRVYVLSVSGYFCCLEGDSGQVVWERSLHEEFGLLSTYGGRTHSPLIFEETVLISAVIIGWGDAPEWGFLARPAHRFLSFDKATGALRWLKGTAISPYDTTYSTPTLTTLGGQAAMVFGSGDGSIWALQPRTGEPIWHFPLSRRGVNVSPLVVGDTIYASHSEENIVGNTMGGLVALDGSQSGDLTGKALWQQHEVMSGKSSPLLVEGRLWTIDDRAKLRIFDPTTGEQIARKALGTVMRSTPLYADGKVFCCTHNGRWYILQPTKKGVKVLHKLRLKGESSDGSPMVSQGRIYFPTSAALYCLGKETLAAPKTLSPTNRLPPRPSEETQTETRALGNTTPALVQVVPQDVLLKPGEQASFQARIFNSDGQLLRTYPRTLIEASSGQGSSNKKSVLGRAVRVLFSSDADWTVQGSGSWVGNVFTASSESTHEAALVVCKVDGLQGSARVRIVPPLPWKFDFNTTDEKVPLTWVGGRVRYVLRDVDGEKIAVKRTVLPTPRDPNNKLGTRSRMWMGPANLANYTIQADFALQSSVTPSTFADLNVPQPPKIEKMSDFGLINSRYTMTVRSSNKKLRLYSWSPHDYRTFAEVDFDPEPGKWYTMKLQVETSSIRGKLWPRGQAEPTEWTVQMLDTSPNLSGSPGLYGNAQEAEIYVDNVSVVEN